MFVTGIAVKCGFVLGQVHQRTIYGTVKITKKKKNKSSKSIANNVCSKIRLRETAAW